MDLIVDSALTLTRSRIHFLVLPDLYMLVVWFLFSEINAICLDFGGCGEDLEVLLVPGILTPNR